MENLLFLGVPILKHIRVYSTLISNFEQKIGWNDLNKAYQLKECL